MNQTPQPDPVAAAQEAAARAADATADAYRALAQITRQFANPQGEAMPWDEPEAAAPVQASVTEAAAPAEATPPDPDPEPTPAACPAPAPAEPPSLATAAEPDPTTPLTPEQQAQARAWVGAMSSAAQRKAFAAAFRHAFSVDPAEKSVAPLIVQWQHYAFVDRFVIEAAGGVAP